METFDDSSLTPTQIVSWVVTYDPLPELAINPKKSWFLKSNTVQQGDSIYFSVAIENISPFDMDSLKIKYYLEILGFHCLHCLHVLHWGIGSDLGTT